MKEFRRQHGNKTLCMAPWTHTYLSPQTERRMCCASTEKAESFEQYIDTGSANKKYNPKTLQQHWNNIVTALTFLKALLPCIVWTSCKLA